jgi:hypothetical protein
MGSLPRSRRPRAERYRRSLLVASACLLIATGLCVLLWPQQRPGGGAPAGLAGWLDDEAHAAAAAYHSHMKHQLLLASHNRLFWYDTHTGNVTVLHEGEVNGQHEPRRRLAPPAPGGCMRACL